MVKSLPAMQEARVRSLGCEDPLEKGNTPVFSPGESHGQRSLAGYSPWDGEELDKTDRLTLLPQAHCNHLGPILKSKGWAGPSLACSPFARLPTASPGLFRMPLPRPFPAAWPSSSSSSRSCGFHDPGWSPLLRLHGHHPAVFRTMVLQLLVLSSHSRPPQTDGLERFGSRHLSA